MKCEVVKLSDVCDLIAGFAFKSKDFGDFEDKVIKIADIVPPRVDMKGLRGVNLSNYNKDKLEKFIAKPGDYVLAMTGATIGKIGRIYEKSAYINQRVLLFRPHKEIDKDFLYYTICAKSFYDYIISFVDSETAQPNISATTIGKYELYLPDLNTQKKIASILQSLDDKIELNNKINENLEQQAQSLYKTMFTNNPNLEITQGVLSDIAVITMGQSPSGSSYNEDGNGDVFYQGRAEFGFRFPTRRLFTTEPKRMAEANDVLLSVRAPVGDLNVAYEQCCVGRGLSAIHSKNDNSSFLLYTMFALKPQLDIFNGEGTVFGSINKDGLGNLPVDIPRAEEIAKFETIVRPMDDLIRTNYEENCRLQMLRDSLLTKLMNGEINVDGI